MKKFVFASVMALASLSLVPAHTLRAQDQSTIQIKDPAEYNAYQMATTQSDPKAKAAAIEDFLTCLEAADGCSVPVLPFGDCRGRPSSQEGSCDSRRRVSQGTDDV